MYTVPPTGLCRYATVGQVDRIRRDFPNVVPVRKHQD
jgi:hypothetical protein